MVDTRFKSLIADSEVEFIQHNEQYGFDIKLIPLKEAKCQILFTEGVSDFEQKVKEGYEEFQRIELYFCLPDYWKINEQNWPVKWLNLLAQVPQKNNTWFGPGDTIPAGNPPEILSDRFPANHFMLSESIQLAEEMEAIQKEMEVQFLAVIPICQKEIDYKLANSATVLLARLKHKGFSEKVDMFRTSVCRKRFLGF